MTSAVWENHSLSNPALDAPVGAKLEEFVGYIGREFRPVEDRDCELRSLASALRKSFNLKPPILEYKTLTFLDVAGVHQRPNALDTTFCYNRQMARWEIYVKSIHPHELSREIWHEVWEILFWRCFHRIPWWHEWARRKGFFSPHDKADEFAFQMLLPAQSVPSHATRLCYDVWQLASRYGVPVNLAFRALQEHTKFPHPTVFVLLQLDVPPPQNTGLFGGSVLFGDETVYAKVLKKAFKPGKDGEALTSQLDAEYQRRWQAVEGMKTMLNKRGGKDLVLEFSNDDIVYRYGRHVEPTLRENIQNLFGIDLPAPVSVISRVSPKNSNNLFLQVMPSGCENAFLERRIEPVDLETGAMRSWKVNTDMAANRKASDWRALLLPFPLTLTMTCWRMTLFHAWY